MIRTCTKENHMTSLHRYLNECACALRAQLPHRYLERQYAYMLAECLKSMERYCPLPSDILLIDVTPLSLSLGLGSERPLFMKTAMLRPPNTACMQYVDPRRVLDSSIC